MNKYALPLLTALLVSDISQAKINPNNSLQWQFGYDEQGRMIKQIDPAQRKTTIDYIEDSNNALKRIVETRPDGSKITSDFDAFARLSKATGNGQTTHYDYDGFSRLKAVRSNERPSITYGYDSQDRINAVSVGKTALTATSYDFLGRVESIETPAGLITYDYQSAQAKVIQTLPNGFISVMERSANGQMKSITHANNKNVVLLQFKYHYRPDGLINKVEEYAAKTGNRTLQYQYDNVQRLVGVIDSSTDKTIYSYDTLGNRLTVKQSKIASISSQFDWAGRLTHLKGKAVEHDAVGNLIALPNLTGKTQFEYAVNNALSAVISKASQVAYRYDASGLMIERSVNNKTTAFVPNPLTDNWQPLQANHANGSKTVYIWAGNLLLASMTGDHVQYYLHDHLGSIRAVVNGQTNKLETFDYDAFGHPMQAVQSADLKPGFAGLFYDAQAALYLTRARGYSPELGRFLQIDPQHRVPFGSQKDLSAYVYCGNDPVNFVDLDGYAPQSYESMYWRPIEVENRFINYPDIPSVNKVFSNAMNDMVIKPAILNATKGLAKQWLGDDYDFADALWTSAKHAKKVEKILQKAGTANDFPDYYDLFLDITKWGVKGTLAGTASGQILTAKKLYTDLYRDVRSVYTQKQSEKLVTMPLGVSRQISPQVFGTANRNFGTYKMTGRNGFSATGDWQRDGSVLNMHAKWRHDDTYLHTGARFSGSFEKWVNESTKGSTYAKRTVSHSRYRDSFNGAEVGQHLDVYNRTGVYSPPAIEPTNVGGVYLSGAGKALTGFDDIQGISVDEKTGRLVLLSKTDKRIGLPPLRLDDVVTIFRCVYQHGAPFVSIDPVPSNPEGPMMNVRHSPCTDDTYVGWILFETDRLMKAYSLGEDNVTRKAIQSNIPNYQNLLQLGFFNRKAGKTQPLWERFWIVPDQLTRASSKKEQLSLFSVPLKVNTQRMKLLNGKMVSVKNGKSSPSATDFKDWFTKYYTDIAAENCRINPNQPNQACVPVFNELRRIALITAIAERLRDQNVAIPVWMLDYTVAAFPMDSTTPAIVVENSQGRMTQRIYGGVELSGFDRFGDINTDDPIANKLLTAVESKMSAIPLMTGLSISDGESAYQAVALPGNDAQALGANRLEVNDLSVSLPSGQSITLSRSSNSFFQPHGVLGRGWTMDLPHLLALQKPIKRDKKGVTYQSTFQLTSPLNSYSEIFAKTAYVKEVNGEILVPEKSDDILGLAMGLNEKIGTKTDQIIFQDQRRWHFDNDGYFVAEESVLMTIVYRRDAAHRIKRIEGWVGDAFHADIKLDYQTDGKLKSAVASNGERVNYQYDDEGYLSHVNQGKIKTEYQYREGLLSTVSQAGKIIQKFSYNDQGQLISEQLADGTQQRYDLKTIAGGMEITVKGSKSGKEQMIRGYDKAYRPLYTKYPDGSRRDWQYTTKDSSKMTYTNKQGQHYSISSSDKGKRQTLQLAEGGTVTEKFDAAGRLIASFQGSQPVLEQKWQNGLLSAVETKNSGMYPQYDKDGVLDSVMFAKPVVGKTFSQWMNVQLDTAGRPMKITDYTGNQIQVAYDQQGQTALLKSPRGDVDIKRDQAGRIGQVKTSWGMQVDNTYNDKTDDLEQVYFLMDGKSASIHFSNGKVDNISHYDGSKTDYRYYEDQNHQGKVQSIKLPNQLNLSYDYDQAHRISAVDMSDRAGFQYQYNDDGQLIGLEYRAIN